VVTHEVYSLAMRRCPERGLRSGAVFDAVQLVCAEVSSAPHSAHRGRDFS